MGAYVLYESYSTYEHVIRRYPTVVFQVRSPPTDCGIMYVVDRWAVCRLDTCNAGHPCARTVTDSVAVQYCTMQCRAEITRCRYMREAPAEKEPTRADSNSFQSLDALCPWTVARRQEQSTIE